MEKSFVEPMLAYPIERSAYDALLKEPRFIAEPKFDGQRGLIVVRDHKTSAVYSRIGNGLLGLSAFEWFKEVKWPMKSALLDSELCSAMGVSVAGRTAGAGRNWAGEDVNAVIFDLIELDGKDLKQLSWTERRAKLDKAFKGWKHPRIQVTPYSTDPLALWKRWVGELGGEGIILKDKSAPYRPGVRSFSWLKITVEINVDVVIAGATDKDSNGKPYKTGAWAPIYGLWDPKIKKVVVIGQGLGPELRGTKEMIEGHLGKVAEVRCKGWLATGALRSAFFKRWRDDKKMTDCTL